MLTRSATMSLVWGTLASIGLLACAGGQPARADETAQVTPSNSSTSETQLTDTVPGDNAAGATGGGTGNGPGICSRADGRIIDCNGPDNTVWNGSCWERVFFDSPAAALVHFNDGDLPYAGADDTDFWAYYAPGGHATTTGVIVICYDPDGGPTRVFWRESAAPPPSAAQLAAAAELLLKVRLTAPGIGLFPGRLDGDDSGDDDGLVGWPTWFWADAPGDGVAGPLTLSTSVNGYTLRATASLDDIVYDTGDDGHTVTCHLGHEPTAAEKAQRADPPPPCSWTYSQRGDYTVTATTHLTIAWTGAGRSGTVPVTVSRSGHYHVGEIQVLVIP